MVAVGEVGGSICLSVWSLLSVLVCLAVGRDLFCVVSEEEGLRGRNGRYWRDG